MRHRIPQDCFVSSIMYDAVDILSIVNLSIYRIYVCLTRAQPLIGCTKQEGLAAASIARDDPSTIPGDDPFPRARMHRDRNAW